MTERFRGVFTLALGAALACPCQAQDADRKWAFNGFGTLAVTGTDTHRKAFVRDLAQPNGAVDQPNLKLDSRLGLQLSRWFTPNLQATLQVVSKYRYDGSFGPDVTMAYLNWNPLADVDLRVGRMTHEGHGGADSRNVGYSYLYVRPPVEAYGKVFPQTYDGMDLTSTLALGEHGTLRVKGYFGNGFERIPVATEAQRFEGPTGGLLTEWVSGPWRLQLNGAVFTQKRGWPPSIQAIPDALNQLAVAFHDPNYAQVADSLSFQNNRISMVSAYVAWEQGPVQASAQFLRTRSQRPMIPDQSSGFVSVGYSLGAATPYLVYSRLVSSRPPRANLESLRYLPLPSAAELVDAVYLIQATAQNDQHTLGAGLRWELTPSTALKFQVDQVDTHNSFGLWSHLQANPPDRVRVFTVALDFIFGGRR